MNKLKVFLSALLCVSGFFCASAESWSGTGFALKGKYIITNHHVVDGARTLQVRGVKGDFTKLYNAVVVAKDESHDMAIIRIEDSKFTGFGEIPYTLKSGLSEVGEEVFVLGYPLLSTMGEEVKLTTGIVSSRSGFQGEVSAYQVSAPIQPGNSGGPLFDANGDVVGIVNAKHRQADNASYAIKSPYMRLFIQNSIGDSAIPTNRKMVGWSLVNKTKAIKQFVYIIYANTEGGTTAQTTPANPNTTPQTPAQPQIREYRAGDTYKVGDIVSKNGVKGVVFEVTDGGRHGKIVSVKQSSEGLKWITDTNEVRLIGANNVHNGAYNMSVVKQIDGWRSKYPAFAWCADLGEGWYLPAKEELLTMYSNKDAVNNSLRAINAAELCWYLSSTESNEFCAWYVYMNDGSTYDFNKIDDGYVRAVSAF